MRWPRLVPFSPPAARATRRASEAARDAGRLIRHGRTGDARGLIAEVRHHLDVAEKQLQSEEDT